MKSLVSSRLLIFLLLILTTVGLVGCAPDASAAIISPQLGEQLAAQREGSVVSAEPTPVPPKLAELTDEQIYAGLPAEIADLMGTANPDNGANLSLANGCIGCHGLDPSVQMVGPTWYNVGDTAVSRVAGESPALYLYNSITNPGAYAVPNYPAGVMPATYGETLASSDLADLLAYLLTQNGQP